MSTLHPYEDRKKLKWMTGFFLSEHTTALAQEDKKQGFVVEPKPQMTQEEIHEVLSHAVLKNKAVAVQLNETYEGKFKPDITGRIDAYHGTHMCVGSSMVDLENMRNVEIKEDKKWSALG